MDDKDPASEDLRKRILGRGNTMCHGHEVTERFHV